MAENPKIPQKPNGSPESSTTEINTRRLTEVVIEIGDHRNRNILWPITQVVLRGRWNRSNLSGTTMAQVMTAMPDLPGMHISCDPSRQQARIFDPLADESNADLLFKAQRIHEQAYRTTAGPEKPILQENMTDTEIKTWLYWMRRFVDNNQARIIHGHLLDQEDIKKLPGKTKCELNNSSIHAKKFREDPDPIYG